MTTQHRDINIDDYIYLKMANTDAPMVVRIFRTKIKLLPIFSNARKLHEALEWIMPGDVDPSRIWDGIEFTRSIVPSDVKIAADLHVAGGRTRWTEIYLHQTRTEGANPWGVLHPTSPAGVDGNSNPNSSRRDNRRGERSPGQSQCTHEEGGDSLLQEVGAATERPEM